jgi:O-antigen/teichoic acid export membrane protein
LGTAKATFRRNVIWQFAGSTGQAALGALALLLLGRELGASGFGLYAIVLGYVYVANALFEPRVQDLAARHFRDLAPETSPRPRHGRDFADLLAFELAGKALPCLGLWAAAPWLTAWANLPSGSATLLWATAIGIYVSRLGSGLATGVLRVFGRSDLNALCATGELALRLAGLLLLAVTDLLTVERCIALQCLTGTLVNAWQLRLAARRIGADRSSWHGWSVGAAVGRLGPHRRLIASSLGLSMTDLMNKDLDVALIAPLVPPEQVGVYKMAKSIVLIVWRAVDPFYLSLMPEVSRRVAAGSHSALDALLRRSAAGLLLLATTLAAAGYLMVWWFGHSVLGASFDGVRGLMPWMLVGVVLSASLVWAHPLTVALNRADLAFAGSLFGSVVGLAAFLGLVPLLGLRGAGIAWSLAFALNFGFTAVAAQRLWRRVRQPAQ